LTLAVPCRKGGGAAAGDSALIPLARRKTPHSRTALMNQHDAPRTQPQQMMAQEPDQPVSQTVAAGQLRAFIERVERLEEEKKTIADDIKEVFAEMKGSGFDVKAVRTIIRLRRQDQAERQEAESILDLYKAALGME
jgi:uncharacterized protein (UPF0335 family)